MKTIVQNPTFKGVAFIALIFLIAFLFGSCEKEPLPERGPAESLIIEPGNLETFSFSDLNDKGMGWITLKNGEGYNFYFNEEGAAVITSDQAPAEVLYYRSTMDKEPLSLEITDKKTVKKIVGINGSFTFVYPYE